MKQAKATEAEMDNPTISGARYRATHQASVTAILGANTRPVSSRGSRFVNFDRWTARFVTHEMCDWARKNPGCIPTRADVAVWVHKANGTPVPRPEIVIANTPDKLRLRVALALVGGAYHEALHTLYSCRRSVSVDEIADIVLPRWAKVPNWAAVYTLIQDWSNIIEDIRIERRGIEEFPGIVEKLKELQDFVLLQEEEGLEEIRSHGAGPRKRGALTVITATFRDAGLGYETAIQSQAFQKYLSDNPQAVEFVLNGPLRPMLDEAKDLTKDDDLGCLRVALDVIAVLVASSQKQDGEDSDRDESKDGQPGDGERPCPSCGAPAIKLVVRPKSDGRGGKVKGKGLCTCTTCGFQQEVDVKRGDQPKNRDKAEQKPDKGPKFEGFTPEDIDDTEGDGSQDQPSKDKDEQKGQGSGAKDQGAKDQSDEDKGGDEDKAQGSGKGAGQDKRDDEAEGAGGDKGEDKGEDKGDGKRDGEGEDKGDGEGKAGEDKDGTTQPKGKDYSQGGEDNPGKGQSSDTWNDQPDQPNQAPKDHGAGRGRGNMDPQIEGNDWAKRLAEQAVSEAENGQGAGLLDNNKALEQAVAEDQKEEDGQVSRGEHPYRPYDPSLDEVRTVPPSRKGRGHDQVQADLLLDSVRTECSYLRARLAQIFRAMELTDTTHGLRRGKNLSSQFLVDSALAVRAGEEPRRAYWDREVKPDTSMAAAVVLDQSYSMTGILKDCTRILIALTEPLDRLGIPVQVSGFRDGTTAARPDPEDNGSYHRFGGITHDVFKRFDEKFRAVNYRFANTRAVGGTPMADGIQFGLMALNYRTEGHRVLFVVTDGCPTSGGEVIPWQIRKAKEAGIHVVGVGIGEGAKPVKDLFPDYVWSPKVGEIPRMLVAKLNEIVDIRAAKRGMKMKIGTNTPTTR